MNAALVNSGWPPTGPVANHNPFAKEHLNSRGAEGDLVRINGWKDWPP